MVRKQVVSIVLPILLLSGCFGGGEQARPEVAADELAQYRGISHLEIASEAEALVERAKEEGFDFYSPGRIGFMSKELDELNTLAVNPASQLAEVLSLKKSIEFNYNEGLTDKQNVQKHLKPLLDQLAILDGLNSSETFPAKYRDIQDELKDLIKYVQDGRFEKAQGYVPDLLDKMQAFEIKVVKAITLTTTKKLLSALDDKDAEDHAPKALEEAKKRYEEARIYIENNPRNKDEIMRRGHAALYAAERADWITDKVTHFKEVDKDAWESEVAALESLFQPTVNEIQSFQMGNLSLTEQAERLAKDVKKKLEELSLNMEEGDRSKVEMATLEVQLLAAQQQENLLKIRLNEVEEERTDLVSRLNLLVQENERLEMESLGLKSQLSVYAREREEQATSTASEEEMGSDQVNGQMEGDSTDVVSEEMTTTDAPAEDPLDLSTDRELEAEVSAEPEEDAPAEIELPQ